MDNYKHNKTVREEVSDSRWVTEYDEYDRVTYSKDSNGYWCLKFYNDPKEGQNTYTMQPYQVIHKYWELYN